MTLPAVSIILPTYNRERFLPQAFAAIREQRFLDWELIVVDDGSTDGSRAVIAQELRSLPQPSRYIYQENQGAYGARNTGLDHATGKYIAFYDSDDKWLPHHLADCVAALEANPGVDWVYGACRIVEESTGDVVEASTFYKDKHPRAFLHLNTTTNGNLHILSDPRALDCILTSGLFAGLQNSVLRAASLFSGYRFETMHRNEAEDALFLARSAIRGCRFGYIDNIHVDYRIHSGNSSAAGADLDRQERVIVASLRAGEDFVVQLTPHPRIQRVFRRALANHYIWRLGYSTYWTNGMRSKAIAAYRRGLELDRSNMMAWKTFIIARVRTGLGI